MGKDIPGPYTELSLQDQASAFRELIRDQEGHLLQQRALSAMNERVAAQHPDVETRRASAKARDVAKKAAASIELGIVALREELAAVEDGLKSAPAAEER